MKKIETITISECNEIVLDLYGENLSHTFHCATITWSDLVDLNLALDEIKRVWRIVTAVLNA